MKLLIVYYSRTGFAWRYAQWLGEDLSGDLVALKEWKTVDPARYDQVVFGTSVHAGRIRKLGWFRKQLPRLAGKKLAVFFTGAMPPDPATVEQCAAQNLSPEERDRLPVFYLWGGLNYEKMGPVDRWMMGMFQKMLAAKQDPTPQDREAAKMVASSYDKTDRAALKPLEAYLTAR